MPTQLVENVDELDIIFKLDISEQGKCLVRVMKRVFDEIIQVDNIIDFWNYGYAEISSSGKTIFFISMETRQVLLALKSLNPEVTNDGSLIFDINPPILKYLRTKVNAVDETDSTKKIKIRETPAQLKALIDFDESSGLTAQFGYSHDDSFIEPDTVMDKQYLRFGDDIVLLPKTDDKAKEILRNGRVKVDTDDIPEFYETQLPAIRSQFDVDFSESAKEIEVSDKALKPIAHIDFDPQSGATLTVGYELNPNEKLLTYNELPKTSNGQYIRQGKRFQKIKSFFGSYKLQQYLDKGISQIPIKDVPEFFKRDLVLIKNNFNAVLTDMAQSVRVIEMSSQPKVQIDIDGKGWLEFDIVYSADNMKAEFEVLAKNIVHGFYKFDDNTWVDIDSDSIKRTQQELFKLGAIDGFSGGYRVPVDKFASLEEFIDRIGGESQLKEAYRDFLSQLESFESDNNYRLDESIENHLQKQNIILRPYQRAGIHWLNWMQRNYLHGILADDMGLGKTMQAICALSQAYKITTSKNHSLVIAPKSVLIHWQREINRCFPNIDVYLYHGQSRKRDLLKYSKPIIFITTYNTVANDIHYLSEIPFFHVILDEATQIKNPAVKRSQAIKSLNATHRIALSGTPVENRPAELWSIFDFLMRGHLGNHHTFGNKFETPIMQGDRAVSEKLAKRISPFLLRRMKKEVAKDLPDKIIINETCELTNEQKQLYASIQGEVNKARELLQKGETVNYTVHILPVITKLKQLCDHPAIIVNKKYPILDRSEKFDWIIGKIEEILDLKEQVVVFSHFLGMLDLLETELKSKFPLVRIDGSTNNRQVLIDNFNSGRSKIALCSTKATGYGINLTTANHVIHADLWWNPAVEAQATDRVHRIGQTKTVYVYRIITQNTLEERIDKLLTKKLDIADSIMDTVDPSDLGFRKWTQEDLIEILSPID